MTYIILYKLYQHLW